MVQRTSRSSVLLSRCSPHFSIQGRWKTDNGELTIDNERFRLLCFVSFLPVDSAGSNLSETAVFWRGLAGSLDLV